MVEFSTSVKVPNLKPEGTHYKGIIGKHYSFLKSFMIRNQIRGPCWLNLKNVEVENDAANKPNFITVNLKNESPISVAEKQLDFPKLNVLTLHTHRINGRLAAISFRNI